MCVCACVCKSHTCSWGPGGRVGIKRAKRGQVEVGLRQCMNAQEAGGREETEACFTDSFSFALSD